MAINYFTYAILVISLVSAIVGIAPKEKDKNNEEQPQIVFEDSTLYTFNVDNLERIVNSKRAMKYKTKDIMYDGKIILRRADNGTDYIESDVIIKRLEQYKFLNNVKYNRENNILLNTDELFYDGIKKIATNTIKFDGIYNNSTINGKALYLDTNKSVFKSKDTHFEILMDNNNKGNK
ncbi:MAG: hypothetical protein ACNI28_01050 [Arcobacter sp.]|uniref:hypothetical protein n=1 Tax=Arcobacter sp. TaxID=1872629 RepID=UPI003AFF6E52